MKPPDYSRSLYFTPRTPWGRRPQKRPGQGPNYLRESEDEPKPPNILQRVGKGLGQAFRNARPFVGAEAEKVGSEHASVPAPQSGTLLNRPSA